MSCRQFQILWELLQKETLTGRELGRIYLLRNCPELFHGYLSPDSVPSYVAQNFPQRNEELWNVVSTDGILDKEKAHFEQNDNERIIYTHIRCFCQFVKRKKPEARYQLNAAKYRATKLRERLSLSLLAIEAADAITAAGGDIPESIAFYSVFGNIPTYEENFPNKNHPLKKPVDLEEFFNDKMSIRSIIKNINAYNYAVKEAFEFYEIPEIKEFIVSTDDLKSIIADFSRIRRSIMKAIKGNKHQKRILDYYFKSIDIKNLDVPDEEKDRIKIGIRNLSIPFFLSLDMFF